MCKNDTIVSLCRIDRVLSVCRNNRVAYVHRNDRVESVDDKDKLQNCVNNLVQWSHDWMLAFNCDKCKCLHLGKNNTSHEYKIKQEEVSTNMSVTILEKDLGVYIDPELNFDEHIHIQTKKAKSLSGMIMRNFENKSENILLPLYKALIRPVIEYGNVVWSPYLRKNINKIESIQRNYSKNIR